MQVQEMEIYGFNEWGQPFGGPPLPKKKDDVVLEMETDENGKLKSVTQRIIHHDQAATNNSK